MTKEPTVLYHASSNGVIKVFEPRTPNDFGESPDNKRTGVYATDSLRWAMIMGVLQGGKANPSSINLMGENIQGVYYVNEPRPGTFYIYSFEPGPFENVPLGSHQFISERHVKPMGVKEFRVEDHLDLVRKANEEEMKRYHKKIGKKEQ